MTLKATLERFEGRVPHLYLDSAGNVTAGIGHLLSTPESACALPFTEAGGAILSTRETILREYVRVKMLEPNHTAPYYEERTELRLSDALIDALLDHDIATMQRRLSSALDGFTALPDPAQSALMDMAFNIGVGELYKYRKLMSACTARDWARAAQECHRKGIADARNEATAELFRGLAVAA